MIIVGKSSDGERTFYTRSKAKNIVFFRKATVIWTNANKDVRSLPKSLFSEKRCQRSEQPTTYKYD